MAVVSSHTCSVSLHGHQWEWDSYALNTCSHLKFPKHVNLRHTKYPNLYISSFSGNQARQRFCFSPVFCKIEAEPGPDDERQNLGVKAALSTLKFYKREISPLLPKSCRYVPSCSEYSMIAYKKYGFVKGTVLTACRICRCNPLGGSGFDPPRWFDEERVSEEEDL